MRLIKVSLATFTFNKVAASVLCVCVCCIFGGSLTSLPSPPTRLSLFLQAHLRQRGPPHLREHGRAEGRHPGPDPGRQAQGSCGGGAGEGLSRTALWLLEPPTPRCCPSVTQSFFFPSAPPPQFIGAEFGDDNKASASDSSSRLSCVDRAERNSRALSLHNSITKSRSLLVCDPLCLPTVHLKVPSNIHSASVFNP